MRLAAGSRAWLLHHEMRLAWRNIGGNKRIWILVIGGGLIWASIHLLAWLLLRGGSEGANAELASTLLIPTGGAVFWLVFSIVISQTIAHAVSALFDRGDLDLLLSSPLVPGAIFTVRGLGIAVAACLLPFLLLLPFAHAGLIAGHPGLIAIYPVMASFGLTTAAVGILITMTLVRILGARRAKIFAQILAALIGAGFFLLSQLQNLLSRDRQSAIAVWVKNETAAGGWFAPDSVLWWPVRAMFGEWLPLLLVVIIGAGSFWLVVNLTFRRFVSGTQETTTGGSTKSQRHTNTTQRSFRSGLIENLLLKEWKLIVRDPQIISQTLLQILYLIPLLFLGFRSERNEWLLVPGFVIVTSMLAGNLAWLTIAAEDAPELIGTAPISINRVRWIKAIAAVVPVMALLLPLALYWLTRDRYAAFVLILCSGGGMISAALCQIWNPRQGNRRDMKTRHKGNVIVNILESLGGFGWMGVAVSLNGNWRWLPLAVAGVLIGPGMAWVLGRGARRQGLIA